MRSASFLAIFLIVAIGTVAVGTPSSTSDTPESEQVNRIFAAYDRPGSPGCTVGVIRNGNFIHRKSYGKASLELGVPLSSQSVFYMASVSKQFTAASVVLAAEQGFLSLDDDIRKYIPEIPDYGRTITLRQMLHQTSGFSDVLGLLYMSGRNLEDIHPTAELMDLIVRQKSLNFNPGDEFAYSNTNYFLLAEVVKRATHEPLSEFAAENIFRPLGMAHTRFYDDRTQPVPDRVPAYQPAKDGAFHLDWSTNFDMVGGGGLMSSLDDLLLWDRNFYTNKLGKGTFLKEMQTRGVLNSGKEISYALGLYMSTYRGLPIVEHGGGTFGYRTGILRFSNQNFTVLTLCNISSADPASLARKIADIYLRKELQDVPATTPAADLSMYAGKYFEADTHFPLSFDLADGSLLVQGSVLRAIGSNRFIDDSTNGIIAFTNSDGAMKATVNWDNQITFAGVKLAAPRIDDAALAAYAGVYKSAELDATYKLWVDQGSLMLRMNWNRVNKLQPIVQNEFDAGDGSAIVFRRDNNNRVSGLSVFGGWNGWMRQEDFERLN